jgi:predicted MFS family arabinose efflux permease
MLTEGDQPGRTRVATAVGRAVLGMRWEPALSAVSLVTLISGAAFATFWSYVGIWAIEAMRATPAQVGLMFLLCAGLSPPAAWIGGHASDRYGRRFILMCSTGLQSVIILSLTVVGHHVGLGAALVVLAGVIWAPGRSALNAVVADVVPAERRDSAYAMVRTANNLGVVVGPPCAAVLLVVGGWPAFLGGVALLGALTCVLAVSLRLPGRHSEDQDIGLAATVRVLRADRSYLLFLLATLLGFMVYMVFETVLPVVAVVSYHFAPATWGFLYAVNPLFVLLLQVRVIRWTRAWSRTLTLSAGGLLMGLSLLGLLIDSSPVMVTAVVVVFVFGEMLWVPTIQALVSRIAPPHLHGTYLGGYTSCQLLAWMIAPFAGLQVLGVLGERAIWVGFAALAVISTAAGAVAVGTLSRRRET